MSLVQDCTKETCPINLTIYQYAPSLAANATFLALFGLSGLIHLGQAVANRRTTSPWTYSMPTVIGCIGEIIGYVGRIMEHFDPFSGNGFYIQICCLTIAPAFFTASIYFCLGDFVRLYDPNSQISRFKDPRIFAWIFIPCDIISLVLQAAGGGLAATSVEQGDNPDPGTDVMITGLAWQVFTLLIFIVLSLDFAFNIYRSRGSLDKPSISRSASPEKFGTDEATAKITPRSPKMPLKNLLLYIVPFCAAVILIFARCCYRVAELSGGWTGSLIHDETSFIVLEGVWV